MQVIICLKRLFSIDSFFPAENEKGKHSHVLLQLIRFFLARLIHILQLMNDAVKEYSLHFCYGLFIRSTEQEIR